MENNDFEEILNMVVEKMTEHGIQEQRDSNPEIDMLIKDKTLLSVQVKKILDVLDKDSKKILVQYYEQSEAISDMQIKHLYIQGAKDCVQFLKKLGVI